MLSIFFYQPVLQVSDLQSRMQSYDNTMVDKHKVERLEAKTRELESKLELEITTRQRLEVRGHPK